MQYFREINRIYAPRCMGPAALFLLFCGIWPLEPGETRRFLHFTRHVPNICLVLNIAHIILLLGYDIPLKLTSPALLAEATTILLLVVKSLLKCITAIVKQKEIYTMITDINACTSYISDMKTAELLRKYKLYADTLTKYYFTSTLLIGTVMAFYPLLAEKRRFPTHQEFPIEDALETPYFQLLYLFCVTGAVLTNMANPLADMVLTTAVIYLVNFLKVLQFNVESAKQKIEQRTTKKRKLDGLKKNKLFINVNSKGTDPVKDVKTFPNNALRDITSQQTTLKIIRNVAKVQKGSKNKLLKTSTVASQYCLKSKLINSEEEDLQMMSYLKECVIFHKEIIRIRSFLQEHGSYVLTLELILFGVSVGILLFQLATSPFNNLYLLWIGVLFMNVFGQFCYCWASEELADESMNVSDAIYNSDWYRTSVRNRQGMQIIMSRSMMPLRLRCTSFFPYSMDMFSQFLNSSYSCFQMIMKFHGRG